MYSENTAMAIESLLAHIELVGAFEFAKEIFALIGVLCVMYLSLKTFFLLFIWSKPHPHQIQGRQ